MSKNTLVFVEQLGHIRVSIWANKLVGCTLYNTVITRRNRDQSERFQESNSFHIRANLILVRAAVNLAAAWVDSQEHNAGGEQE